MPLYAALEAVSGIIPIVANARHIKAVPGRKTDVFGVTGRAIPCALIDGKATPAQEREAAAMAAWTTTWVPNRSFHSKYAGRRALRFHRIVVS